MEFESVEPAHSRLADLGQPLEDAMSVDAFVVTYFDRSRDDGGRVDADRST